MKKNITSAQDETAIRSAMNELLRRERADGCCMADESLIAPALRKWRSYARRNTKNKHQTLQHRAHDIYKAMVALFPEHNYDPACLRHISESFAGILWEFEKGNQQQCDWRRPVTNPYQSPQASPYQSPQASCNRRKPGRLLLWFSAVVVGLGAVLWVSVVTIIAVEVFYGLSHPMVGIIVALVFTIVLGVVCIPQFFSVFRRSRRCANWVTWVSVVGIVVSLLTAAIYPIAEYELDNSPPGYEILGAIFYLSIAGLFFLNRRLHQNWISLLRHSDLRR